MQIVENASARSGVIIGRGRVVHRGRDIVFLEGSLEDQAGRLIATATSRIIEFVEAEPGEPQNRR